MFDFESDNLEIFIVVKPSTIAIAKLSKNRPITRKKAFERSADIDAGNVIVSVEGHTVKLRGKVHSLTEKDVARKAAYYAAGVYKVDNELEVSN